ncbi:hypothetical protein DFO57_104457, partial [Pantoea sp. AG702]
SSAACVAAGRDKAVSVMSASCVVVFSKSIVPELAQVSHVRAVCRA